MAISNEERLARKRAYWHEYKKRAAVKARLKAYYESDEYAETKKRYRRSERGLEKHRAYQAKWKRTEAGKIAVAKYEKSDLALIRKNRHRHGPNGASYYRTIAVMALGRDLTAEEHVHHINGDHDDNRNCNLMIVDPAFHTWLHHQMDKKTS